MRRHFPAHGHRITGQGSDSVSTIIKVKEKIDDLIGYFVGVILIAMALAIGLSVVDRVVGGQIAWVDELVRAGVVWTTFLGAYAAIAKNKDIKVDIVIRKLPYRIKLICELISDIRVFIFLYCFVQRSFSYVQQFASYKLPMTGMTRGLLYSVFPIGSVFMVVHYILSFIIKCKGLFLPNKAVVKDGEGK